ncbi:hypothetical protein [Piscinibacter defluvii]|uniref:hypothetical protein n=1 Tax=Piscinibacter defluvii TaxID=1796922 RepID=UPI000FDDC4C8|nr:hypothetical protein [Piscinibacter defluvii]
MPRLLLRNQRAIAGTVDARLRARLLAQRALLLARHWRVEELADALAHAEAAVAASADRPALAELELARGVAQYYGAGVAGADATLLRGLDLAREVGDAGIEAECEAWLGCVGATLQHEPAGVLVHLRRALALGETSRPLAAARAAYVLATLCQEAGLIDAATGHYRQASRIAREQHDEQLLAAIVRYMSLGQVQQVRRGQARGRLDVELCRQARAALLGAQRLAKALTDDEQCLQVGLRLGEIHRVGGEHEDALSAFGTHVDAAERRGMTWEAAIARADQAVCLAATGQAGPARQAAARASAALVQVHDAYSQALIRGSLADVALALGESDAAAAQRAESATWWARDTDYCERLRAALAGAPA